MFQKIVKKTLLHDFRRSYQVFCLGVFLCLFVHSSLISQDQPNEELNVVLKETHAYLISSTDLNEEIAFLRAGIQAANSPQKQVLQSLLAELYYDYLIENLEALRTQPIIAETENNIYSWSGRKLIEACAELYRNSLRASQNLQSVQSEDLDFPMKGSGQHFYRPSLYDILAHRALDFFTDPRCILTPAPAEFRMQAQGLIMPPDEFTTALFPLLDSLNHTHLSLEIYRALLTYQLEHESFDALLDTQLRLLKWLRSYASGLDKAGKYVRNLRHLIENYPQHEALADIQYELALVYVSIAGDFQALIGEAYKWEYQRAREICLQTLNEFPDSRGAQKCQALIELIEKPVLRIAAEEVNLPEQAFRVQVNYRNLDHLYFRLYRIPFAEEKTFDNLSRPLVRWDFARQFPVYKTADTYLADAGDYQFHRTETSIPPLAPGTYALCASDSPSFDWENGLIVVLPVKVSGLFTQSIDSPDSTFLYVQDRKNGEGVPDLQIDVSNKKAKERKTTDSAGKVAFAKSPNQYVASSIHLFRGNDSLQETISIPSLVKNPFQAKIKTILLTDKPSYERGDFVAIQGVLSKREADTWLPIADSAVSIVVSLEGKALDTLLTQSNANGIFEAIYPLPLHLQTGKLYLLSGAAFAEFEVIEQEKNSYEIRMEQDRDTYSPADSVVISGKILGPPHSLWEDADLRFLITRDVRFPDWADYNWWKPIPYHREVLLKQGTSLIDSMGCFQVKFSPRPDPSHPRSQRPLYFYKIRVVATDPEGNRLLETYNLLINESGKSLQIEGPDKSQMGGKLSLEFTTRNLRAEKIPFTAQILVESLVAPPHMYRKRRWQIPDLHLVSEDDYRKIFPDDIYGYEDDYRSWAIKDTVYSDSLVSAAGFAKLELASEGWEAGMYRIRMILPFQEDNTLQKRHYLRLIQPKNPRSELPEFFSFELNKKTFEVGDTLQVLLKSALPDLPIHYKVSKGRNTLESRTLPLGTGTFSLNFPISSSHTGTLRLSFSYIFKNEPVELTQEIQVIKSKPEFSLVQNVNKGISIKLAKKPKTPLFAFSSHVATYFPGLSTFTFGIKDAVNPKESEPTIRLPELARAAVAAGQNWNLPIPFPTFTYPSLVQKQEDIASPEELYFRQMAASVLAFPANRRAIPPQHRWINLLANVEKPYEGTPLWAIKLLERELAWKNNASFITTYLEGNSKFPLYHPQNQIPGSYSTLVLLMDARRSFEFKKINQSYHPQVLILTEHEPKAEANAAKELSYTLLNTTSDSLACVANLTLNGQEYAEQIHLREHEVFSFNKAFDLLDKEGVLKSKLQLVSEKDTIDRSSPLFVQKENFVFGRTHIEMAAKAKKKIFPLSPRKQKMQFEIKATRSPAYYALRALPSLVAHVNPTDALSVQQALFSIYILDDFRKNDPAFSEWLEENYEGIFDLNYLDELELRLGQALRNLQLKNGAFTEPESKFPNAELTLQVLQIEKDLRDLGIQSSIFQQQSLEFSLHYLDSLYLHIAPEAIIWNSELGGYITLRKSFSSSPIDAAWRNSWEALLQLHEVEDRPQKAQEEISWIKANLLSKRPGLYWQSSIMKLLKPEWKNLKTEGIKYLAADDFSFVRKKRRIIFRKKRKEMVYVEMF